MSNFLDRIRASTKTLLLEQGETGLDPALGFSWKSCPQSVSARVELDGLENWTGKKRKVATASLAMRQSKHGRDRWTALAD